MREDKGPLWTWIAWGVIILALFIMWASAPDTMSPEGETHDPTGVYEP